jgi:hypothetical protein
MKGYKFIIFIFFIPIFAKAQEKLCYNVVYSSESGLIAKKYANILLVTNAPFQAVEEMRKIAKDEKYKVTFYKDIFPPIRNYSDEEISAIILKNAIDGILFLSVAGEDAEAYEYTFGTFKYAKIQADNGLKKQTDIEGVFIEPNNRNDKLFSCTGNVKDVATPSSFKVFAAIMKKFPEIGILRPELMD